MSSRHSKDTRSLVGLSVIVVLTLALIVTYRILFAQSRFDAIGLLCIAATLSFIFYSVAPLVHPAPQARPRGSVVAVIPCFNEASAAVHETIHSLLNQTYLVREIHVVDDGSAIPLEPFSHERVVWHRQANRGKRFAQGLVLRQLADDPPDFILTVDSDCRVDEHAVEKLLSAFTRRRVQAATGMIFIRNTKLLARAADLQIVTWCLGSRVGQSLFGALNTTSGALSLYRSSVVLDNLDDYLSSRHSDGDDRRLTHYALLRGKVVSVNEAMVYTDMPETLSGLFAQRLRWSKSTWRFTIWEMGHLPIVPLMFQTIFFVSMTLSPLVFATLVGWALYSGHYVAVIQTAVYLVLLGYLATSRYIIARRDYSIGRRLRVWFLMTPVLFVLSVTVLPAAFWYALVKLRSSAWHTRGDSGATATEQQPQLQPAT